MPPSLNSIAAPDAALRRCPSFLTLPLIAAPDDRRRRPRLGYPSVIPGGYPHPRFGSSDLVTALPSPTRGQSPSCFGQQ